MEIKKEEYCVNYDNTKATVFFQGVLRLQGTEGYLPIVKILDAVIEQKQPIITLNLRELKFLNSSGINLISKFVIKMRNQKDVQLVIEGTKQFPWQSKSLKNLVRLMPGLKLVID